MPRIKAVWKPCNGEAHSNPFIDNCWICMPFWGEFPACPSCGSGLGRVNADTKMQFRKCPKCGKSVDIRRGVAETLGVSSSV